MRGALAGLVVACIVVAWPRAPPEQGASRTTEITTL